MISTKQNIFISSCHGQGGHKIQCRETDVILKHLRVVILVVVVVELELELELAGQDCLVSGAVLTGELQDQTSLRRRQQSSRHS